MNDQETTINDLKQLVAQFIEKRDWQQFHTPKNLSMSIAIEAAELMEHFQWMGSQISKDIGHKDRQNIEHEIADITSYILSFCHYYRIDLTCALQNKMNQNELKYPVEKVKGSYKKYKQVKQETKR